MAKKKVKKEIPNISDEMKRFDLWLQEKLDRTFSDDVIVSVLQYHIIKSYIYAGFDFESMMDSMLDQYKILIDQKEEKTG